MAYVYYTSNKSPFTMALESIDNNSCVNVSLISCFFEILNTPKSMFIL